MIRLVTIVADSCSNLAVCSPSMGLPCCTARSVNERWNRGSRFLYLGYYVAALDCVVEGGYRSRGYYGTSTFCYPESRAYREQARTAETIACIRWLFEEKEWMFSVGTSAGGAA
ncbi:MAG: hypothetical protein QXI60_11265 [Thermofilaceae archaeon]